MRDVMHFSFAFINEVMLTIDNAAFIYLDDKQLEL